MTDGRATGQSVPASLTSERTERKFTLPGARAAAFMQALSARLPAHHYDGAGASRLPRARHYSTTVYFDTRSRDLYRAMRRGGSHVKLRAREYYDTFPELVELATSVAQVVRSSPVLWLELKTRDGEHSGKRRVGIPRCELSHFFASGEASEQMRALQEATYGAAGRDVLAELLALRSRLSEPLEPSVIVWYRRAAFQDDAGSLRLTIDRELAAFAPKPGLVESEQALVRSALGEPAAVEKACVLEVKTLGTAPDWLDALLAQHGAASSDYSKFMFASEAVYGRE